MSAKFSRVEHIGLAVKDLNASIENWTRILGQKPYHEEEVESEKVKTVFFQVGETKIELLGGTDPDSVINRFVEKKGEGIHHIAMEVENILAEMKRLQEAGYTLLNESPKRGADNKLICFVHPKETGGVLLELCQTIPEE